MARYFEDLETQLRALPGVRFVGTVNRPPLLGKGMSGGFEVEGQDDLNGWSLYRVVSASYFGTMDMSILRGRGIEDSDRSDQNDVVVINETLARERFLSLVSLVFATLALALACVGVFGVVSYSVAPRTFEIGVRVAVGASASGIMRNVTGPILRAVAVGVAVGTLGALVLSKILRGLLFETAAFGPPVLLLCGRPPSVRNARGPAPGMAGAPAGSSQSPAGRVNTSRGFSGLVPPGACIVGEMIRGARYRGRTVPFSTLVQRIIRAAGVSRVSRYPGRRWLLSGMETQPCDLGD